MDLIERYLAAIGRQLPAKQSADIQAELRDVLVSRIEDRAAELGRPPERAEIEALLVAFGHPMVVAGRYRKIQHLVGPDVFPFWWAGFKVTLGIIGGVYLVLILLGVLAESPAQDYAKVFPSLWSALCIAFAMTTLSAVVVERYVPARVLLKWRPARLPPPRRKTRSPFDRAVEVAADVVFILWWVGLIHFRDLATYPGRIGVELAPVWITFKWWIVTYFTFDIVLNLIGLGKPTLVRLNGWLTISRCGFGAAILAVLDRAGHYLTVSSPTLSAPALGLLQRNFDKGFHIGIVAAIGLFVWQASWEAWCMWRDVPRGA